MYSESDLQTAVEAGAISAEAADALRNHVATLRSSPVVDEENFRLLTGFNDIFVSIASVILLVAVGWLGAAIPLVGHGPLIAVAAWGLAEYFTRIRRMALPSILLLLAFAGGVGFPLFEIAGRIGENVHNRADALLWAGAAALTTGAIWLHWLRFKVPITVAAGALALACLAMALILAAVPQLAQMGKAFFWLVLLAGIGIFALAMWWDMQDRSRTTRRADVAFWLHLAAAPMIAHSMFKLLGVFDGTMGIGMAVTVLLLYVAFGLVALAIDRRALLVSSLAYVLYALYALFEQAGVVEMSPAFTALVIGSALLLLSALWHKARKLVVEKLPDGIRMRLPYLDREFAVA
jgi:hypothetical protein